MLNLHSSKKLLLVLVSFNLQAQFIPENNLENQIEQLQKKIDQARQIQVEQLNHKLSKLRQQQEAEISVLRANLTQTTTKYRECANKSTKATSELAENRSPNALTFTQHPFSADFSVDLFTNLQLDYFTGHALELFNSHSYDDYMFTQGALDFGIDIAKTAGPSYHELFFDIRAKGIFGNSGIFNSTIPRPIKIGIGRTEATYAFQPALQNLWLRELWFKYNINPTYHTDLQIGFFPYAIGSGLTLGNGYKVGKLIPGYYEERFVDQFRPGIMFTGDIWPDKLKYKIYAGLRTNASSNFYDTAQFTYAQDPNQRNLPERGSFFNNTVGAFEIEYHNTHHKIQTDVRPYIIINQENFQQVEFTGDATSTLGIIGINIEAKKDHWSFFFESALNFGAQNVKAWDRDFIDFVSQPNHMYLFQDFQATDTTIYNPCWRSAVNSPCPESQSYTKYNGQEFVDTNDIRYKNAFDRYRQSYQNNYHGLMFYTEAAYHKLHPIKPGVQTTFALAAGYASGDENPNDSFEKLMAIRLYGTCDDNGLGACTGKINTKDYNKQYNGFVGVDQMFLNRNVYSVFMLESQKLNRPLATAESRLTYPLFTNLAFLGLGAKYDQIVDPTRAFTFRFNLLTYWQAQPTKKGYNYGLDILFALGACGSAAADTFTPLLQTDACQTLSQHLGSEINCAINYQFDQNLNFYLAAAAFIPGNYYRDAAGKIIPLEVQYQLAAVDFTGYEMNKQKFNIALDNTTALTFNIGFGYTFDTTPKQHAVFKADLPTNLSTLPAARSYREYALKQAHSYHLNPDQLPLLADLKYRATAVNKPVTLQIYDFDHLQWQPPHIVLPDSQKLPTLNMPQYRPTKLKANALCALTNRSNEPADHSSANTTNPPAHDIILAAQATTPSISSVVTKPTSKPYFNLATTELELLKPLQFAPDFATNNWNDPRRSKAILIVASDMPNITNVTPNIKPLIASDLPISNIVQMPLPTHKQVKLVAEPRSAWTNTLVLPTVTTADLAINAISNTLDYQKPSTRKAKLARTKAMATAVNVPTPQHSRTLSPTELALLAALQYQDLAQQPIALTNTSDATNLILPALTVPTITAPYSSKNLTLNSWPYTTHARKTIALAINNNPTVPAFKLPDTVIIPVKPLSTLNAPLYRTLISKSVTLTAPSATALTSTIDLPTVTTATTCLGPTIALPYYAPLAPKTSLTTNAISTLAAPTVPNITNSDLAINAISNTLDYQKPSARKAKLARTKAMATAVTVPTPQHSRTLSPTELALLAALQYQDLAQQPIALADTASTTNLILPALTVPTITAPYSSKNLALNNWPYTTCARKTIALAINNNPTVLVFKLPDTVITPARPLATLNAPLYRTLISKSVTLTAPSITALTSTIALPTVASYSALPISNTLQMQLPTPKQIKLVTEPRSAWTNTLVLPTVTSSDLAINNIPSTLNYQKPSTRKAKLVQTKPMATAVAIPTPQHSRTLSPTELALLAALQYQDLVQQPIALADTTGTTSLILPALTVPTITAPYSSKNLILNNWPYTTHARKTIALAINNNPTVPVCNLPTTVITPVRPLATLNAPLYRTLISKSVTLTAPSATALTSTINLPTVTTAATCLGPTIALPYYAPLAPKTSLTTNAISTLAAPPITALTGTADLPIVTSFELAINAIPNTLNYQKPSTRKAKLVPTKPMATAVIIPTLQQNRTLSPTELALLETLQYQDLVQQSTALADTTGTTSLVMPTATIPTTTAPYNSKNLALNNWPYTTHARQTVALAINNNPKVLVCNLPNTVITPVRPLANLNTPLYRTVIPKTVTLTVPSITTLTGTVKLPTVTAATTYLGPTITALPNQQNLTLNNWPYITYTRKTVALAASNPSVPVFKLPDTVITPAQPLPTLNLNYQQPLIKHTPLTTKSITVTVDLSTPDQRRTLSITELALLEVLQPVLPNITPVSLTAPKATSFAAYTLKLPTVMVAKTATLTTANHSHTLLNLPIITTAALQQNLKVTAPVRARKSRTDNSNDTSLSVQERALIDSYKRNFTI